VPLELLKYAEIHLPGALSGPDGAKRLHDDVEQFQRMPKILDPGILVVYVYVYVYVSRELLVGAG
jgi:hypothetical protein